MSSATRITNLLYRYAELLDSGDLEGVTALLAKACLKTGNDVVEGEDAVRILWRDSVRLYSCGTPRTKHLITNPIVEIDEDAGTATCRSYYTVLQATPEVPLQAICAGRYHDRFVREGGDWRFSERDYSMLDLVGDLSQHQLPVAST